MDVKNMSTAQLYWVLHQLKKTRNNTMIRLDTISGLKRLARIDELEKRIGQELRCRGEEKHSAAP